MYGNSIVSSSLSLGKIVSGISKTLRIANQVIPIYKQAKPLINNFSSTLNLLKTIKKPSTDTKKEAPKQIITPKSIEIPKNNIPKFFI